MAHYATFKTRPRRRFGWGSQFVRNERLSPAAELVRGPVFRASVLICLPDGEILPADVVEHGQRMQVVGKGGRVTIAPGVFWRLVDAARKANAK